MAAAAAVGGATLSPSPLDSVSTAAALDALLAWLRAQQKHRKAQLLEHDEPVQLLLSLRRIPSTGRTNPYLLPLPHPIHTSPSICLLLHDRCPLPPDTADSHLRSLPFPSSTKAIPLSSLRSDYVPFEARRRLCGSFDLFFADRRILPLLPRLLGKVFFKKKKHPLRVDVARKGWLGQIRKGCSSARMHVGTGTCVHVDVGRVSMTKGEILDNVAAVVDAAVRKIPKGWGNVRGVYLKLEDSVALPIYQALPEIGTKIKVPTKVEEGGEAKGEEEKRRKKKKIGKNLDNSNDDDSKRRSRKEKKLGEMRYMDVVIDREDSVGESEEEDSEVEVAGGKKRRKTGGKREEDKDGEIVGDVGGDGSGADLGEGERKSLKKVGKKKKKMVKKVKKGGEFGGADGGSVESVDVGDGGEDDGEDHVVKSMGKKRKRKKKGKGEEAAEEVEDVLMVAGDIDVEDISKDDEEYGVDHAMKGMDKRKKKKDMKRKGEEAAEEVEDVSEVAKDGIGRTKGKAKSILRSKEWKKSKRKKVNG